MAIERVDPAQLRQDGDGGRRLVRIAAMTAVRLQNVSKHFGDTVALKGVDLDIAAGELFFLLGPSGCGKSTVLRLIAGLTDPTSGHVFFNGRDVTRLPTEKRNAVMCFQSYALWPHMTVRDNIRFGLEVRKYSAAAQKERVAEMLKLVQMGEFADRKPNQLSGGQQQRVALARALAVSPDCLLLDEPLSNLDAKLRLEMRAEIRRICKAAGCTTIYVTHDQKEALSVADRLAILKDGKVVQFGPPGEVYLRPWNSFVADFIGPTNLLRGEIISRDEKLAQVETGAGLIMASVEAIKSGKVVLSVRPERMRLSLQPSNYITPTTNQMRAKVLESTYLGESSEHVVLAHGARLRVVSAPPLWEPPSEIVVEFDAKDVVVLPE